VWKKTPARIVKVCRGGHVGKMCELDLQVRICSMQKITLFTQKECVMQAIEEHCQITHKGSIGLAMRRSRYQEQFQKQTRGCQGDARDGEFPVIAAIHRGLC